MTELFSAVAIVIAVSAICSLFEAVLYAVPDSHVERLVESGSSAGRVLKRLRSDIDGPIAAILSLNTIAHTAGAAVAGALAAKALGSQWLGAFSAVFTLVILVFSEVIPKTAGVVHARTLSGLIARPLQVLVKLFFPLVWVCRFVTRLVARERPTTDVSEEEILTMARMGLRAGSIHADEAEVIERILTLPSKTARQIMTPRTVVFSLRGSETLEEARRNKQIQQYSRIPIYDENPDDIIGLVYRPEVLAPDSAVAKVTPLFKLTRPVDFVPDSKPLNALLKMFLERRQHMFIVLNEFGEFAGVVTLEDVLEEILGQEIVDESDKVADLRELARSRRQKIKVSRK